MTSDDLKKAKGVITSYVITNGGENANDHAAAFAANQLIFDLDRIGERVSSLTETAGKVENPKLRAALETLIRAHAEQADIVGRDLSMTADEMQHDAPETGKAAAWAERSARAGVSTGAQIG